MGFNLMGRTAQGPKLRRRKGESPWVVRFWDGRRQRDFSCKTTDRILAEQRAQDIYAQVMVGNSADPRCESMSDELDDITPLVPPNKGGVYAIRGAPGFIKIGRTKNIRKRVADFRGYSPYKVGLVAILSWDRKDEERWLRKFHQYRERGEWFRVTQTVATQILKARTER
jgi:hypothetical protein